MKRSTGTRILLGTVAAVLVGAPSGEAAASNPRALGVRLTCSRGQTPGAVATQVAAHGSAATTCAGLSGWFDGRLEWVSRGSVLFREDGPFLGMPGGAGEVQIIHSTSELFKNAAIGYLPGWLTVIALLSFYGWLTYIIVKHHEKPGELAYGEVHV